MTDLSRRERADQVWAEVFGRPASAPSSPLECAMLDFACAEVWGRRGLSRRDRRLLTLACITADGLRDPVRSSTRAALASGELTVDELHEVALHLAAYVGFPVVSSVLRDAIATAADDLGAHRRGNASEPPCREVPRREEGTAIQELLRGGPVPQPQDALGEASFDFVAADVWGRPGLAWRDRRLLTLAVVARAALAREAALHVRSALDSGDLTPDELHEICLHLAVYLGFPRAHVLHRAVLAVLGDPGDGNPTVNEHS